MEHMGFVIVDRRTGEKASQALFLTERSAEAHITEWQDRHDRGGRPDVTREQLLNMAVVPLEAMPLR